MAAVYRPATLAGYIGQAALRDQLGVAIAAARGRAEALDHVLLYGPPGLGKTTLAQIVAHELGVGFKSTSGPVLEKPGDVVALLTSLAPKDVLFIDEIHRMPITLEEILYSAMEDYRVDIVVGEGETRRTISLPLPPFTLIGATTRAGSLSAPLRDRFGLLGRLQYYQAEELAVILGNAAQAGGDSITAEAAQRLAERARGTPRIALRLLRRARDIACVQGCSTITSAAVDEALRLVGVGRAGLDDMDQRVLKVLCNCTAPIGLETLALSVGETAGTLEDVVEPFLIQSGFLQRTPRGRIATEQARNYLQAVSVDRAAEYRTNC